MFTLQINLLLFPYLRTQYILKKKAFLKWISRHKNTDYQRFIILCGPRTGSTLLHTYLNAHSGILSYGEVLRRTVEKGRKLAYRELFPPQPGFVQAAGPKVFYEYYEDPAFREIFQELLDDKSVKVLHITRKDVLRMFVSWKIAEEAGVWNDMKKAGMAGRKVYVDPGEFRSFAHQYQEEVSTFRSLFSDHQVYELTYEGLTNDPDTTLKGVQEFLEVPEQELFTLLKKQNPEPLEALVENYAPGIRRGKSGIRRGRLP